MSECEDWLSECLQVFPEIKRKTISICYKKTSAKRLGCVSAKIERKLDFNAEALLLGEQSQVRERKAKPKEFKIMLNDKLLKIGNTALRKQVAQNVIIHELLHITNEDLFTLAKAYGKRRKKKIHVNEFEHEAFRRYNQLRALKGIAEIQKREHLDAAICRVLESIRWHE